MEKIYNLIFRLLCFLNTYSIQPLYMICCFECVRIQNAVNHFHRRAYKILPCLFSPLAVQRENRLEHLLLAYILLSFNSFNFPSTDYTIIQYQCVCIRAQLNRHIRIYTQNCVYKSDDDKSGTRATFCALNV